MIGTLQERADRPDVAFEVGPPQFMRVLIERHDLALPEPLQIHRGYLRGHHRAGLSALEDHYRAIDRTETVPQQHLRRFALERLRNLGTGALRHGCDCSLSPLRRESAIARRIVANDNARKSARLLRGKSERIRGAHRIAHHRKSLVTKLRGGNSDIGNMIFETIAASRRVTASASAEAHRDTSPRRQRLHLLNIVFGHAEGARHDQKRRQRRVSLLRETVEAHRFILHPSFFYRHTLLRLCPLSTSRIYRLLAKF